MTEIPLDVFGQLTPTRAQVYARVVQQPDGQSGTVEIRGRIRGPFSKLARTLPALTNFQTIAGEGTLATAIIPDPCFWTPLLPFHYDVELQITIAGETTDWKGMLGLRPLGASGRNLVWDARRWVLRGVHQSRVPETAIETWRELAAVVVAENPDQSLCEAASRWGVPVVARLESTTSISDALVRLARWPSVIMAVVPEDFVPSKPSRSPNLLLARSSESVSGDAWVDAVWAAKESAVTLSDQSGQPTMCEQAAARYDSLEDARSACDALQRELAPSGQFAGYIV